MAFVVTGAPGLLKQLAEDAALLDRVSARKAFREGAKIIALDARGKAPRDSGTLQRSLIWFIAKRAGSRAGARKIESFAWVNVLKGRVKAPHALIVEKGRRAVEPRKKRALKFEIGRIAVYARRARSVPATRFFERAVAGSGHRALSHIVARLERIIAGVA